MFVFKYINGLLIFIIFCVVILAKNQVNLGDIPSDYFQQKAGYI